MRVRGITIPDEKQIQYAMTVMYGIGLSRSQSMLTDLSIDPLIKTKDLTEEQEQKIREALEPLTLEGDLRREKSMNIKRLRDIKCYRGQRHDVNLPVNGQRTKTNSRTVRGNKRQTMGSGRVKLSLK